MDQDGVNLVFSDDHFEHQDVNQYASRAYLEYAMSVNKGRALPFTQDGLKPVHRRILHALNQLNLTPSSAPAKSARIVGEVIGKYHPHGDQSVYDAMVRTAQNFSLRYPLVDGQGNFGSRDGDGAAAMRYTEVRLSKYAELYLSELKKGTVEWTSNYDGSFEEPKILPARLPMLMANGSTGIGVGMACEMPSHNLTELASAAILLIKNPNASIDEVMEFVKGPDLPCGGQIISPVKAIKSAYETGRGSLTVRAISHFEELARGQWQLVIDEIPPEGSASKVMEQLEECLNPKLKKDQKSLSLEQSNLKALSASLIDLVRDESGKDHQLRLVITPQSSKVDRDALLALLYKNTSLESNISFNMVAVDRNGTPKSMNFIELMKEWIAHRFDCMTNRTRSRLSDVDARIHILEGLHLVYLNVDEVIRIVREAEDPKVTLMTRFDLSDIQADYILDMRLRQLSKLENIKIEQELDKLKIEKTELESLLADDSKMKRLMVKEIQADADKFGDSRRTIIEVAEVVETKHAALSVADDPISIIVSDKGWVRSKNGHKLEAETLSFKEGDQLKTIIECRTVNTMIVISQKGRVYSLLAGMIPGGRGDGVPITSLIDLQPGDTVAHMIIGNEDQRVLIVTNNSFGFITTIGNMMSKLKAGKQFITLKDNGTLLTPKLLSESDEHLSLVAVSSQGKLLAFPMSEFKTLNAGGQGVTIMDIAETDRLVDVVAIINQKEAVEVSGMEGKKNITCEVNPVVDEKFMGKRARKGCVLPKKMTPITIKVIQCLEQPGPTPSPELSIKKEVQQKSSAKTTISKEDHHREKDQINDETNHTKENIEFNKTPTRKRHIF